MICINEDDNDRQEEIEGYTCMFEQKGLPHDLAEKAAIDVIDGYYTFTGAYEKYTSQPLHND